MNPSEYLLTKLSEECVETSHAVHKALTFGLDDHHPDNLITNQEQIIREFIDIDATFNLLVDLGLLNLDLVDYEELYQRKKEKIIQYSQYSLASGNLSEPLPNPELEQITLEQGFF